MRPFVLLRGLTPLSWVVTAGIVLAVIVLLGRGLGVRWDPFGLTERRLDDAERQVAAARTATAARRIEAEGATDQARRIDDFHQQAATVARETARAIAQTRSAHGAEVTLDPDSTARLARHDRELCRLAPAVCGTPSPDASTRGDDAL